MKWNLKAVQFNVVTLFPQMIKEALKEGVVGQALRRGEITLNVVNPRDFATDIHKTVDDRPFGGGDGMVMQAAPLVAAFDSLKMQNVSLGRRIFLSAHGRRWSDSLAREFVAQQPVVTLVCGRYGGVDQRFINTHIDEEISVGDFILSGGELAALTIIDSMGRLKPGVLGNAVSSDFESFSNGLLEAPLFTRPQETLGAKVPDELISGDHKKIEAFRRALSLVVTLEKRPDLLTKAHEIEMSQAAQSLKRWPREDLKNCGLSDKTLNWIFK